MRSRWCRRLIPVLAAGAVAAAAGPPVATVIPQSAVTPDTPPTALLRAGDDTVGRVWLSWDAAALSVRYEIRDPSPLRNAGGDRNLLFKTGDSVDLQVGTDPNADRRRTGPAPGDVRLLLTVHDGSAQAVLYLYQVPGTAAPMLFASPTGRVTVDRIDHLSSKDILWARSGTGYSIRARLPWTTLTGGRTFAPAPGTVLHGDVGVLFSDPVGKVTVERIYWANRDTGIVADIPSEIRLSPAAWGELRLAAPVR